MQSVDAAFTAEAKDTTRKIAHNLQLSWKRSFNSANVPFQIGVSMIGGTDFIGNSSASITSAWNRYQYSDESAYVMQLSWDRKLSLPLGGISIARANASLDNNTGRFLPDYLGGSSELFTAIQPKKPMIINSGFNYDGIDNMVPSFIGILDKNPVINLSNRRVDLSALDFLDFLNNRRIDDKAIYTGQRVDQMLDDIFRNKFNLGTAQYELDMGSDVIPFAALEPGTKYGDFVNKIVQAELGHLFQDEAGIIHFWNRQKWGTSPYNQVRDIIYTAQVLDVETPGDDHIINVVEVTAKPRKKTSGATLYTLVTPIELQPGTNDVWVDFDNPVISAGTPSHTANQNSDGSGTNDTGNVPLTGQSVFIRTAKYTFNNTTGRTSYITALTITGTWATEVDTIYRTNQDDSSVTAYDEKVVSINNEYIQSESQANSIIALILDQFAEQENLLKMTIKAKPQLQLGDLISWQGNYWRIFGIETSLDPSSGFIQTLDLVQRNINVYFTIGVSQVGGGDQIAP